MPEFGGRDDRGGVIVDDNVLMCFNASEADVRFTLPPEGYGRLWTVAVDTASPTTETKSPAGSIVTVIARSVLVLISERSL